MNWKKIISIGAICLTAFTGLGYYLIFGAGPRNILDEKASFVLNANELQHPFKNGEHRTAVSYIDEVAQVNGSVTAYEGNTLELDYKVQVNLVNNPDSTVQIGSVVSVKGRCVGYDDLLEVVKMDQAMLLDNNTNDFNL